MITLDNFENFVPYKILVRGKSIMIQMPFPNWKKPHPVNGLQP